MFKGAGNTNNFVDVIYGWSLDDIPRGISVPSDDQVELEPGPHGDGEAKLLVHVDEELVLLLGGAHPLHSVAEALVGVVEVRLGEGDRRHGVPLARLHVHHAGLEALETGVLVLQAVAGVVRVVELAAGVAVTAQKVLLGDKPDSLHSVLHHILKSRNCRYDTEENVEKQFVLTFS